jgi:hydroxyethylthiazole kinase-like uncharacterized protein yjeF
MRDLEARSETLGISTNELMNNAGFSIASHIAKNMGPLKGLKVVSLVGTGNNGSDCLIASGHLAKWGASVTAVILKPRSEPDLRRQETLGMGISLIDISEVKENCSFFSVHSLLRNAHVIVDGILGIGTSLPIRDPFKTVLSDIRALNEKKAKVFSIDVPSGVDSDTSAVDSSAFKPDVTLALGHLKPCHVNQPAADFCGEIIICDIGLPNHLSVEINTALLCDEYVRLILPGRSTSSHKGSYGKAMVVGGSDNYIGAPVLAASSAMKTGLGLVTIATFEHLVNPMANMFPEATFLSLKEDGMDIRSGQHMARQIFEAVEDYKVLLIGCGFGTSRTTYRIFRNLVLSDIKLPQLVLDADGLNMLSKISNWWGKIPFNTILTPHPKEMSRLTRLPVSEIQSDRLNVAKTFSKQWGVIVVLKGANTVICDPNGSSTISPFANPILSSAGTGDVLAGLIAGFAGQGSSPLEASSLGVYTHGKTAESISLQIGSSGLLATELANNVPFTIKYLRD